MTSKGGWSVVVLARDGVGAAEALRGYGALGVECASSGDVKGTSVVRGGFPDKASAGRAFDGICSIFGGTRTAVELWSATEEKRVRVAHLGPRG